MKGKSNERGKRGKLYEIWEIRLLMSRDQVGNEYSHGNEL
jgi:hypothetical protein